MPRTADACVIGGGFYGASVALFLARSCDRVVLLEQGPDLLTRASYANQARVHAGYHYPRSMMTALRSSINFTRFISDYHDCIDQSFTKIYAIARDSKVTGSQFAKMCQSIGAPLRPATNEYAHLFNTSLIHEVFEAREVAFDAVKLRARLKTELEAAGVEVRYKVTVRRVSTGPHGDVEVYLEPGAVDLRSRQVFACAYAQTNTILRDSGLPLLPVKHEVVEIPLIDVPEAVRHLGITIMDGPFFSVMPFPAGGRHSLHHVRYSPHHYWHDSLEYRDAYAHLKRQQLRSNYPLMIKDAARYMPVLGDATYVESLWEIKTVLRQNEVDDGRPILYRKNYGLDGLSILLGAKIDNIYDVIGALEPMSTAPTVS